MIPISNQNTKDIIAAVDKLSAGRLQQKNDLEILIEKAIKEDNLIILEELAFNAKYAGSLIRIIQKKEPVNDEAFLKKAVAEYSGSIQKIKNCLTGLLKNDVFLLPIFSDKYLLLSRQCLTNMNGLCNDLGYLKLFFNDLKRGE